jgi:hypothetical protein
MQAVGRMRHNGKFLAGTVLLLCGLLFSGCTFMKSPFTSDRPSTSQPNNIDGYLAYYRYTSNLSSEEQKKEYAMVNQAYAKNKNDSSRLQLALLLSLPNTSFKDDSRALSLLKEFLANKATDSSQQKDFALLLSTYIAEHKRQEEKLKTEQGRNEELEQKLETLKEKLKTEQSHGEELEQKLEALKGIEKSIIERQQSQPAMTK